MKECSNKDEKFKERYHKFLEMEKLLKDAIHNSNVNLNAKHDLWTKNISL